MTLRHYKIFVAVCDSMNMTAAAEALFMSQSAVSQAVAELENYYGVRLFERLSRKLYLTQAGEKLLSYARHMIRMNAEVERDMKSLRVSSSLRIGASVTVGANVLPRLVAAFKKESPQTDVEVFEDNTEQMEKMILRDRIDLALVEGDITSPDVVSRPFMKDELILIFSPGHRFAGSAPIEPRALGQEDFIIREQGSGTRKTFEQVMAANALAFRATWVCNNADTIKMAVAEGLGVSFISRRAVENELRAGSLRTAPVGGLRFERSFKTAFHKNKYLTPPIRSFLDLCYRSGDGQ